jgi:hypothetical protein
MDSPEGIRVNIFSRLAELQGQTIIKPCGSATVTAGSGGSDAAAAAGAAGVVSKSK